VVDAAAATVAKRNLAPAPSECWIVAEAITGPSCGGARKESSDSGSAESELGNSIEVAGRRRAPGLHSVRKGGTVVGFEAGG